jgi:Fe-S cluster assembly protein SufD
VAGTHDATVDRLNEDAPDWLISRRQEGLAAWASQAMPTGKDEDWRYVDLDFSLDDYRPVETAGEAMEADEFVSAIGDPLATATLVDGCATAIDSEIVHLGTADRSADVPRLAERYGAGVSPALNVFTAAHQALAPAGVVVYLPKGSAHERPVVVDLQAVTDGSVSFPHVSIVMEDNSEASVVVVSRSAPGVDALHVPIVEASVGDGSRLKLTTVQNHDRAARSIATHSITLGRDASVTIGEVGLGAAYGRQRLALNLDGAGASARMNGIYFGDGDQVLDYRVYVTHRGPQTSSDIFLKGAVEDRAHAVWTGLVRIEHEAVGTTAFETNRNLVLSEGARVNSVPNLEILTDDLQCGHGSSSGPLDEEHLYYLMSRGLPHERAERLLVRGFFEEIISKLPAAGLAEPSRRAVHDKYVMAQLEGRV